MLEEKEVRKKKVNHRGHNEGSCYQRKDGKWMGQIQVGFKPDGSRKFITKTAKTKQEISNWLASTRNDILKNDYIDSQNITVEQWLWNWMVTYKIKSVSPNTYTRYLIFMNKYIVPTLGRIKLKELKSMHIQKFYNQLQDGGMAYSSIKHIHSMLNQSLDCAVRENMISKNFALYTTRSKPRTKTEVAVLTPEQQKKIIDNLPFSVVGVLIRTALATGARLGELLGLSWSDVDFENNVIHIRNGLVKENTFSEDGKKIVSHKLVLGALKTQKSKRDIPIAESIASLLKKYKLQQKKFIMVDIIPTLVFPSSSGALWDESNARKQYAKFLKSLDIPYIKFHALRHTFATRIMEANVHPKVAQELLGHSTVTITMDTYSHVLPEQKRDAIDKIKEII